MPRLGIICGGSGSSKFARVFYRYPGKFGKEDLGFVANVADNFWYHGVYVCPDVDILTYSLSGQLDYSKGWGVRFDTFGSKKSLSELESPYSWFGLGDRDLGFALRRTELMSQGWSLSGVTDHFCKSMKIESAVIPATDDSVQTFVRTTSGTMHLQEYWVKYHAIPRPFEIEYSGIEDAMPNEKLKDFISNVIICPANPITSISPTMRLKGVQKMLKSAKVVAISPFVGNKPVSGPVGALMSGLSLEPNSFGVAKIYSSFLKTLLVDTKEESSIIGKIKDIGIECLRTNTMLRDEPSGKKIAEELLSMF